MYVVVSSLPFPTLCLLVFEGIRFGGRDHIVHGDIVGLGWHVLHRRKKGKPHLRSRHVLEEPVIITLSVAQPIAFFVEGEQGDNRHADAGCFLRLPAGGDGYTPQTMLNKPCLFC